MWYLFATKFLKNYCRLRAQVFWFCSEWSKRWQITFFLEDGTSAWSGVQNIEFSWSKRHKWEPLRRVGISLVMMRSSASKRRVGVAISIEVDCIFLSQQEYATCAVPLPKVWDWGCAPSRHLGYLNLVVWAIWGACGFGCGVAQPLTRGSSQHLFEMLRKKFEFVQGNTGLSSKCWIRWRWLIQPRSDPPMKNFTFRERVD